MAVIKGGGACVLGGFGSLLGLLVFGPFLHAVRLAHVALLSAPWRVLALF